MKQLSDWYTIKRKEVLKRGGWGIFKHHSTLLDALQAAYPEFQWSPSGFLDGAKDRNKRNTTRKLMRILENVERKIGIAKPEDWYTVTLADLREVGFPYSVRKARLLELLTERYPDHRWDKATLLRGKYLQQSRFQKVVESLFPDTPIFVNARKEANLVNPETNDYFELDLYLPSLNLAFEFQERHHYTGTEFMYKPLENVQQQDSKKREEAAKRGITVVTIPEWWDGTTESAAATIRKYRPDLLREGYEKIEGIPIPEEIPEEFLKSYADYHVEGIGKPTTACFFTKSAMNPEGWWLFEKYDGVRGFWNPEKKEFYSRKGNKLNIPQRIIDTMPTNLFLDGELWFGKDNFQEALKMVNTIDNSALQWDKFKYMVFDIPTEKGETYQDRYNKLVKEIDAHSSKEFIEIAPMEPCKGSEHLEEKFQDIVDKGGEGIILRDPNAALQPGRSLGFLKHKKFRDAEARVVRAVGRYKWECELPNGVLFEASATKQFLKRWNPQPGDLVSFKHHGYLHTTKKPKIPSIYRMRPDLTWQDVLTNWKEKKPSKTAWQPIRKSSSGNQRKPKGYYLSAENRRKEFCDFAKEMGFDPLVPENWNNVLWTQVVLKKGHGILSIGNGSLRESLKLTFPELNFNFTERMRKDFWKNQANCRNFFDNYAKQMNFDPLQLENWYCLKLGDITKVQGGHGINLQHKGFRNALRFAYPELQFSDWQS